MQLIDAPATDESRALIPTTALEPYEGRPTNRDDRRFPIPTYFEGKEYRAAPEIEEIAKRLIGSVDHYLGHLARTQIGYYWKAKGGKSKGRARLGQTSKLSGFTDFLAEHEFTVFISADNCMAARLTYFQMEALVYHELSHIAIKPTDDDDAEDELVIVGHDLEEFHSVLRLYGDWEPALTEAKDILQGRMELEE